MLNPVQHERPTASELLQRVLAVRLLRKRERIPDSAAVAAATTYTAATVSKTRSKAAFRARNGSGDPEEPVGKRTRQMAALAL